MAAYDEATAYNDTLGYDDVATPYYSVAVVDRFGTPFAGLDDVSRIEPIRKTRNEASTGGIVLHNLDPDATAVIALEREIHYRRNGVLYDWQVPTRLESTVDATADTVNIGTDGLLWYFDSRFIGRADRTNHLTNPEFESNLSSWTTTGATSSADTSRKITGTKAAKLTAASAGNDWYLTQTVAIAAGTLGEAITVAGWFYIDETGWVGGALEDRGLFIQSRRASIVESVDFSIIDDDTPRGVWQRAEAIINIPPNDARSIDVRLYAPGTTGGIWWDATSLTLMESLSYYATDQATIAGNIVTHAQDTGYSKSSLNIGIDVPATGVLRDRHYQFAEHQNVASALSEFPALDNGFDYDMVLTDSSRTFTTYYPRKGTSRPAVTLDECSSVRWLFDGTSAVSSVTLLAEGDGPDREEGAAIDTAVFGGLTLEAVEAAPTGTPIDALDSRAAEVLRAKKNPRVLETTFGPGLRIGALEVGDTATITIDHGFMQVTGTWRAIATTLDPATDQLSVEWNPA